MDDNDLLAAVRMDFAGVRMSTEADAILADGGSLRNRRRAYVAAATAVCAVAAISGATLASGSSGATHAELTAWTVQKESNGTIDVTIRDLTHLAGLAQRLRADGVPAEVVSEAHYPASCVDYPAMKKDMPSVIRLNLGVPDASYAFVIHPAGIPSGTKLLLDVTQPGGLGDRLWGFGAHSVKSGISVSAGMGLVHANGNC